MKACFGFGPPNVRLWAASHASILAVFDAASLHGPPGTTLVARPVAPATRFARALRRLLSLKIGKYVLGVQKEIGPDHVRMCVEVASLACTGGPFVSGGRLGFPSGPPAADRRPPGAYYR